MSKSELRVSKMHKSLNSIVTQNEPPNEKTNNLHMRKQRRRSASRLPLISDFVFATQIVHFLFFLNLKFQDSSLLLCLCSSVCVGPVRKPYCWFSHEAAQILDNLLNPLNRLRLYLYWSYFGCLGVTLAVT